MADRCFPLHRRELLAGLGAAALSPAIAGIAVAQSRPSLMLKARSGVIALRPGGPETPIWALRTPASETGPRFKRGEQLQGTLGNELPVPAILNWRGIDGVPSAEPLLARVPLAAGANDSFQMPLRHAGTFLGDVRL